MTNRYADPFLNALMASHQMSAHIELWYPTRLAGFGDRTYYKVGQTGEDPALVSGSVSGDRAGSVRRTAQLTIDPSALTSALFGPYLKPYGTRVKIFRGVRDPGGSVNEIQVFYGRIDVVDSSLAGVNLRCSDLAADVVDARFLEGMSPSGLPGAPTTILATIKALITDAVPDITNFDTTGITAADPTLSANTSWTQERGDALDSLATQMPATSNTTGCEWFIDMNGKACIWPLPAVISASTLPDWIIDSGDTGVLIDRVTTVDRQGVYNGVSVDGEPVGGITPAHGKWQNTTQNGAAANDPLLWGGPFGKVTNFYTGQQLDPNRTSAADELAKQLCINSMASVRSVNVTCVPNPKLRLGAVVRVEAGARAVDTNGMYFVQNLTLPLDPDSAMTMTLYQALQSTSALGYEPASLRIPKGATWQPTQ